MNGATIAAIAEALPLPEGDIYEATPSETRGPVSILSLDVAGIAEQGCDAATEQIDPDMATRQESLHAAFDDQWNEVECAIRETAFAVGLEYGRRLARLDAGGAR